MLAGSTKQLSRHYELLGLPKKASEALLKYNEATGSREKKAVPESRRYRSSPPILHKQLAQFTVTNCHSVDMDLKLAEFYKQEPTQTQDQPAAAFHWLKNGIKMLSVYSNVLWYR